jgi:prepilin-type processing-associated H-X9-DG protein
MLYADDHEDRVPPNASGSGSRGGWVDGWLNFDVGWTDNTNTLFLTNAKIGPYTKNIGIYKCPADIYNCIMAKMSLPRVRSVSMNSFVGVSPSEGYGARQTPPCYEYHKLSDIKRPPPTGLWVFVDEHPDSINDGWLTDDPGSTTYWGDLPGSYHSGGTEFGYADGHAEHKKWQDGYNAATGNGTVQPVRQVYRTGYPDPNGRDLLWYSERTSARKEQ